MEVAVMGHFVRSVGIGFVLMTIVCIPVTTANDKVPYNEDTENVGVWLEVWGKANVKDSGGKFVLHHFTDRMYAVTSPLNWKPDDPKSDIQPIIVPKGFVTDFASVPRLFWAAYPPEGDYGFPAVFHDYLYWTQSVSRKEADRIFKIMMDEFEVGKISTATIHGVVRAAGGFAWLRNQKDCSKGERRLLARTPDDQPNTKWEDWKKENDVFGTQICQSQ